MRREGGKRKFERVEGRGERGGGGVGGREGGEVRRSGVGLGLRGGWLEREEAHGGGRERRRGLRVCGGESAEGVR